MPMGPREVATPALSGHPKGLAAARAAYARLEALGS